MLRPYKEASRLRKSPQLGDAKPPHGQRVLASEISYACPQMQNEVMVTSCAEPVLLVEFEVAGVA